MDHRLPIVIALMEKNMRRRLTLGEMARSVNLKPESLCRIFKAEIGQSPARYFKRLRMQKARELLETTCLSVKEIISVVGIKDGSHFVRDFETKYGLSPMRYRAQYRNRSRPRP